MIILNVGTNVNNKKTIVDTLETKLKDVRYKYERAKNEELSINESITVIEKEQEEKSAKEQLKSQEIITALEDELREIEVNDKSNEMMNVIRNKEAQLEALKDQYTNLINEEKALNSLHKEQQQHCISFFNNTIKPLESVIHYI